MNRAKLLRISAEPIELGAMQAVDGAKVLLADPCCERAACVSRAASRRRSPSARRGPLAAARPRADSSRGTVARRPRRAARGLRAAAALSEVAPGRRRLARSSAMFEVQAIISRTYAVSHCGRHAREGFDLCSTTHCQLYEPRGCGRRGGPPAVARGRAAHGRRDPQVRPRAGPRAVPRRLRRLHEHAAAVWGGAARRISSRGPTTAPAKDAHARLAVRRVAGRRCGARSTPTRARASSGNARRASRSSSRDDAGRAEQIAARAADAAARQRRGRSRRRVFGEVLTPRVRPRAIRSTLFDVRRDRRDVRVFRKGFGHGVGLCQAGALARLTPARRRRDVLRHYYPGVTVIAARIRARRSESEASDDLGRQSDPRSLIPELRAPPSARHRIHDDVDRELRVVLALEALVPPVVVPLAAVVLVAVEHAEPAAVLDAAQIVVDDVVPPAVQLVRGGRRAVLEREEAAIERMLAWAASAACPPRGTSSASPLRSSSRRAR